MREEKLILLGYFNAFAMRKKNMELPAALHILCQQLMEGLNTRDRYATST
jgi:hypothetical protein